MTMKNLHSFSYSLNENKNIYPENRKEKILASFVTTERDNCERSFVFSPTEKNTGAGPSACRSNFAKNNLHKTNYAKTQLVEDQLEANFYFKYFF